MSGRLTVARIVPFLFGALAVLLILLAGQGKVAALLSVCCALLVAAVAIVGRERLATLALYGAMVLAPMDNVRPIPGGLLTMSDLGFGLGFILLAPTILRRRPYLPPLFLLGSAILTIATLVASAMAESPTGSLLIFMRLLAAAILLPVAFAWWHPPLREVNLLAWSYVGGQVINTLYAVTIGPSGAHGREVGFTQHPNYLGLNAMVAFALLIYLHTQTKREQRWIVLLAATIVGYSALISGSRTALLAMGTAVILFPLIERSIVNAYALFIGSVVLALSLKSLVTLLGPGSALARIMPGDAAASYSNQAREESLQIYWAQFKAHPVFGEGFTIAQFNGHNVYLQVAVATGLIGLVGFLILGWSLVRPLISGSPLHGLSYVAVAYAAIGPITPSLWDRNVWAGLGLAILAGVAPDRLGDPQHPVRTTPALQNEDAT